MGGGGNDGPVQIPGGTVYVTRVVIVSSVVMIPAALTCEIYFLPLQASQNGLQ